MKRLTFLLPVLLLCTACCAQAQLHLTTPDNTPLRPGTKATIRWDRPEVRDSVRFEYSPDGGSNWIRVEGACSGLMCLWNIPVDISAGRCLLRADGIAPAQNTAPVRLNVSRIELKGIYLNHDGSRCVTVTNGGDIWRDPDTVQLWDTRTGKALSPAVCGRLYNQSGMDAAEMLNLTGIYCTITRSYVSLDTNARGLTRIYTRDAAQVWNAQDGRLLLAFDSLLDYSPEFSPNGRFCTTKFADGSTAVWDVLRGKSVLRWADEVTCRFNHDGQFIAVVQRLPDTDDAWHTALYHTQTGQRVAVLSSHPNRYHYSVCFEGEGDQYVITDDGHTLRRFLTQTGAPVDSMPGSLNSDALISPDSSRMYKYDQVLQKEVLIDMKSGQCVAPINPETDCSWPASAFSPDSRFLILKTDFGRYKLYDAVTGRFLYNIVCPWNHRQIMRYCDDCGANLSEPTEFSADGRYVVISPSCQAEGRIWPAVFDTRTGRRLQILKNVHQAFFTPNGKSLVVLKNDMRYPAGRKDDAPRTVYMLTDIRSGRMKAMLGTQADRDGVWEVDKSDTVCYYDGLMARLWDMNAGKPVAEFSHAKPVTYACSRNNRLITSDQSGRRRLWDLGKKVLIRELNRGMVTGDDFDKNISLYFVNNGRYVQTDAAILNDDAVHVNGACIWDADTGAEVVSPDNPIPYEQPGMIYSADGSTVIQSGYASALIYRLPFPGKARRLSDTVSFRLIPQSLPRADTPGRGDAPVSPAEPVEPVEPVHRPVVPGAVTTPALGLSGYPDPVSTIDTSGDCSAIGDQLFRGGCRGDLSAQCRFNVPMIIRQRLLSP